MTAIAVHAAPDRARLELRAGTVVPRRIECTATSARVALVAGGALLLGGDAIEIDVTVGEGCVLELHDIGGTVAYDADGARASWAVHARIAAGGTLVWHGLPFVVAGGADVGRELRLDLAGDATALVRETLVLGRDGERGGRARLRTIASVDDEPLFIEELVVDGAAPVPGVLGGNRVLDTVLALGRRAPAAPPDALELEGPGWVARALGTSAHRSSLDKTWAAGCRGTDWDAVRAAAVLEPS